MGCNPVSIKCLHSLKIAAWIGRYAEIQWSLALRFQQLSEKLSPGAK
jgi:hypothetical protein